MGEVNPALMLVPNMFGRIARKCFHVIWISPL
uniref:Uncharacterized protein n=1 Tax=Candidatus Methanogaster sp. ANME-2c ERB4 TaxID=2759911 RepID=A0A7G9YPH3_9EURY|nr:hypothetical protein GKKIKBAN_00021 [Methanosarcinales archaeon ANME-2c ERB4]